MSTYALLGILAVALALSGYVLWRRGFFSSRTSLVKRQTYGIRTALWFASIFIVSWPLRQYRASMGDTAYVIAAIAILALFFLIGLFATSFLAKRARARGDVA